MVPSTHTAGNHDIISSDQGEQIINLKVLVPLRTLRQYAEQMKHIVIQPQAVGFCRFHQRIDDCTRLRALGCIGKEPSLPANDKRADDVFNLVVADFDLTMLKKRIEVSPAPRILCVLNLVVAAIPIRNQDAAEALKEIPRPFSASALPIFEAAQLNLEACYADRRSYGQLKPLNCHDTSRC